MKRKEFIRNVLMGFAATLLPKMLCPSEPDVVDEMTKAQLKLQAAINKEAPPGVYRDFTYRMWAGSWMYEKYQEELVKSADYHRYKLKNKS